MITPRHALLVNHRLDSERIGKFFRFIGTLNNHEVRQCIAYRQVFVNGIATDMGVLLLSGELSSPTFHKVRALPASAETKLGFVKEDQYFTPLTRTRCYPVGSTTPSPASVPCIGVNALVYHPTSRYAFAADWHRGYTVQQLYGDDTPVYLEAYFQSSAWIPSRVGGLAEGDSGHPVFVLFQNELVLLAQWHTAASTETYTGPWFGLAINDVNRTIGEMDRDELGFSTGYAMGVVNLDNFGDD